MSITIVNINVIDTIPMVNIVPYRMKNMMSSGGIPSGIAPIAPPGGPPAPWPPPAPGLPAPLPGHPGM